MESTTNWLSRKVWLLNAIVWLCSVLPGMAPAVVPGSGFESDWQSFVAMGLLMVVPQVLLGPLVLHRAQQIAVTASPGRDTWLRAATLVLWPAALGSISVTAVDMALSRTSLDLQVWMFVALGRFPYYACHFTALAGFALAVTHRQTALLRQRQLAEARLRALRAQLQPHFLFNTLNGIAAASRTEPELATRMLALLGDLLRDTLRERNGELVALDEERRVLQPYVDLQQLRFGDRLRIEFDLPEDLRTAAVPDLLLQPLVENAVEHGVESRPEGGIVRITARRNGDQLEILVQDDGKGPGETTAGRGLGLSTTKERLRELFGDAAGVELTALPVGTLARVVLPYREVARAA
jgi:hypothetical protein